MLLCLDVGNSAIFAGVFQQEQLIATFRYNTHATSSSDQLGVFLRSVLKEKNIDPVAIKAIALCSVVPSMDYSVQSACQKYFSIKPFVVAPGVKTGLKIEYKNPLEVGSDRIVNAMGAVAQFPHKPLLIVDLGTATTFCAVSADKRYLGGVIQIGMRLAIEALQNNTAKLPGVEIAEPQHFMGITTKSSLQSGVYFGQLAMIQWMISQVKDQVFPGESLCVIGTGGFARGFAKQGIFDVVLPDLVLHGLRVAYDLNQEHSVCS